MARISPPMVNSRASIATGNRNSRSVAEVTGPIESQLNAFEQSLAARTCFGGTEQFGKILCAGGTGEGHDVRTAGCIFHEGLQTRTRFFGTTVS